MAKVAVLVTNLFEDIELTDPVGALKDAGHTVTFIEKDADNIVSGKHGTEVTIDAGIHHVSPKDFDALLLPGGFSPDQLRADERFVDFVRYFLLADKPVFAICHGPQLFIQTGLAKGRKMTAYKSVQPDLYYAGAIVKDASAVVDRQLVTSRNPNDIPDFNVAMLKVLS
ncbi:type 1 glutamine amidotransferase domain-containing protein [Leuconostoc fallax]|uniref:DJ-1/PfpI domain-containing protein n=1 Tax=Leuconostoc fallax TaxID=1251 RepID=A0A4R5N8Q9_9LACO|nr:type 1 glutamine amidotransferase domain-containing protein [Leuconostoc fallax]MBU7455430.1 type 1 glutamine amidotransferase [Leuconostoc fallax]TDG68322.1 hypothetical protein C5L23_000628 [Leuconostoc fallax]